MGDLIYEEETYAVRGAIFEVYKVMGPGFLEAVYQECLAREFGRRGIPFQEQAELKLAHKGDPLIQTYRADFVCHGKIIVEIKAVKDPASEHHAQLFHYLRATGMRLGLLVNFCARDKVKIERFAL